jgi:hypothetical protein
MAAAAMEKSAWARMVIAGETPRRRGCPCFTDVRRYRYMNDSLGLFPVFRLIQSSYCCETAGDILAFSCSAAKWAAPIRIPTTMRNFMMRQSLKKASTTLDGRG